jgi:hypothetical protein
MLNHTICFYIFLSKIWFSSFERLDWMHTKWNMFLYFWNEKIFSEILVEKWVFEYQINILQCKSTTSILNIIRVKIYEEPTNNFKLIFEFFLEFLGIYLGLFDKKNHFHSKQNCQKAVLSKQPLRPKIIQ